MHILIEEYRYNYQDVCAIVRGLEDLHDSKGHVSLDWVGYYFNPSKEVNDCVFILPKVLLEVDPTDKKEKVFGHIIPESLIDADKCTELSATERKFLYELSVWLYRAISIFKEHEFDRFGSNKRPPSIVRQRQAPILGHSRRRKSNTFLDVLLALQQWNKDNKQFVLFVLKNIHSGYNKINWTRTIGHSTAIIQDGTPIYLKPINKKRQINFDEELLIIYYSILAHIHEKYGFPLSIDVNYSLITGKKFKHYLDGYGKKRLQQIRYKYFSDKSKELWELCYAFFSRPYQVNLNIDQREYLLVKKFHIVFETIIDHLVAGDQQLPKKLKDQEDGKIVDHLFRFNELTNNESDKIIYYIGDSKYYKRGNNLDKYSVYKQFTYVRNVIQWNIDLFNDDNPKIEKDGHVKLRDDATEGYNIIPNFFISAHQKELERLDDIQLAKDKKQQYYFSRQFENRLFDRDTFLLAHYDVNFLFILALYGRNNQSAQANWREKVRKMFRKETQEMLKKHYQFYAITAHEDVDPEHYIKENFQFVLGKVYHAFENDGEQQYYSLALRNPDAFTKDTEHDRRLREEIRDENESVKFRLLQSFYMKECPLGTDPRILKHDENWPIVTPLPHCDIQPSLLTFHYLENYPNASFLIGGFNKERQLAWMFGRKNGKRDDAYNVRIGRNIPGGVVKSRDYIKHAKFVILYEFDDSQPERVFKVYRVKNIGEMTKQQLISQGYVNPHYDKYLCYFFDEEVSIGDIDIARLLSESRIEMKENYFEGMPIYKTGEELIKYRK